MFLSRSFSPLIPGNIHKTLHKMYSQGEKKKKELEKVLKFKESVFVTVLLGLPWWLRR